MEENLQKQKLELEIAEKELETKEFVQSYSPLTRYFLIFLVVMIIPIFFIAKYATGSIYFNNFTKNAIAVHPAVFTSLPVQVVDAKILPIRNNSYSAYAQIRNQNKDLVSTNLNYTFNFLDASGKQIGSYSGSDFLQAGQVKYLIAPNVILSGQPAKLDVEIPNQNWQKRIDAPNILISGGLPTHADARDPQGFTVDGNFTESSSYTLQAVTIKAIVHDKNDQVIAVSQRLENVVGPQQQRGYHFYWPFFLESSVGRVEVVFETNPFDSSNLK